MKPNDPTTPPTDDSWQTKEVFDQAKQDLQSRLADVKDAARHTAHEMQGAASTTAQAARDGYQAMRHDAATHYLTYREELEHHVRAQPLQTLGLAALGGLILGLLVRK